MEGMQSRGRPPHSAGAGGVCRTLARFRKRLPKEAGATERKRIARSETAGVTARSVKRSDGTEAVKADGVCERREDAEG